ncbi:hypothetical protein EW026_g6501 [Hermanssonia centrifuga]|uniref:DUF6535 domain-containing protein n=1 Tax=Hermanssonia centrifuga TaxID=98765 RepID=A0A4S4KAT3_9APHY|nr:hypothetical protein EW026_g6501 [Hermanssonia centrifuga]
MSDDLLNNQGTDYAESTFSSGSHVKSIHAAKDASSRPQPLNLTGWPEMAETLRQVDEDKVKDYKEDIDTLLVFAGLFSGVLTAFLIQSSQSLSEDTSVTAVTFLRQISAQTSSYSFNAGFFNSTVHPLAENLPPFVAAPSAVRINALWFASLTLALVTASFAMLVKQWLREYLSAESTSAKARIRIREFRSIGLQDWKVFEIAAILPLLLQISLGLFFIGLCLFSWSAHAGIGYTTTPIVIGWAFLFFNATLAPMISARCPYKTTLLKRAMQTLRRMLCSSRFLRTFYCGPMKGEGLYPLEERDAAADDGIDIAILTTADAILLDDDLLATTIRGSLQETRAKPAEIMSFVLEAVRQRLQETSSFTKLTHFLDLSQLTERAWRALINITAQTLILDDNDESPVNLSEDCREDAITIILSSPGNFLTPEADNALASCMRTALVPTCRLIGLRHAPQSLSHILQRLRNTFRGLNTEDTLRALFNIVLPNGDVCDAAHGSQSHTFLELGDLLLRHTGELPYTDIGNILQDCVNRGFLAMDFVRWTPSTINIALVIAVDAVRADDKLLTAVLQNVSLDDGAQLSLILKLCMHTLCIPSASLPCIPQLHYNFNLSVSRWTIIVKTVAQILLQRMRQIL